MLTDGVCSLCSGQKLQNVNVPDKWLIVETVETCDLMVGVCSLQRFMADVAADIPLTSQSPPT